MFTINLSFSAGFQKPKHLAPPMAETKDANPVKDPSGERTAQGIDNILRYSFTLPEGDDA